VNLIRSLSLSFQATGSNFIIDYSIKLELLILKRQILRQELNGKDTSDLRSRSGEGTNLKGQCMEKKEIKLKTKKKN